MRTTITLDDSLFHRLEAVAERSHRSFKDVLNEAVQAGLNLRGGDENAVPFAVTPIATRIRSGIDEGRLNAINDESEAEAFIEAERRR